jgi:hypothetical protein
MPRFLSPAWFEEVASRTPADEADPNEYDHERLVLCQVVRDSPDGDVRYHVVVQGAVARLVPPGLDPGPADLTITTDWGTATAIARGTVAAQAALIEGRLRVNGNLAAVARLSEGLAGLDPVPEALRDRTTY